MSERLRKGYKVTRKPGMGWLAKRPDGKDVIENISWSSFSVARSVCIIDAWTSTFRAALREQKDASQEARDA